MSHQRPRSAESATSQHTLTNEGVSTICPHDVTVTERTIVVLGVGRGGTSAVAGMLSQLGVFMGDRPGDVNHEDRRLSAAIEGQDYDGAASIVEEYDRRYSIWAWKRPSAFKHLPFIDEHFRHPHYVCVMRDVAAIAGRRQVSMGFDTLRSASGALGAYAKIVEFVGQSERPTLLVSYEKLLLDPRPAATMLAQWVFVDSPALVEKAMASIQTSPDYYRRNSSLKASERPH